MSDDTPLSVVGLEVAGTSAFAEFLPTRGTTCTRAFLEGVDGPVSVVWSPDGFARAGARPTAGGIPILAPYPGRLATTSVVFDGRRYDLEPRDTFGRPMHGFAHDRPWRLLTRSSDHFSAEFLLSRDAPERLLSWPADFRLVARWQLTRTSLVCSLEMEALGRMPAALGLHPYLPLPISPGSDPECCSLELPCTLWQPQVDMLPSGPLLPASDRHGFPGRVPLGGAVLDDVFTGGSLGGAEPHTVFTARLVDPAGPSIAVDWTAAFSTCVVFTPPHRNAICIEPYSCLPGGDSFDVSRGWRILEPGEKLSGSMTIRLEDRG